jgi:orotate phosphoribosyltransferase
VAAVPVLQHNDRRWAPLRDTVEKTSLSVGDYILASGKRSHYHFQLRQATMLGGVANTIAEIILEYMQRHNIRNIGGLVQGAVPLAVAAMIIGHQKSYPVSAFFVRKETKQHGREEMIDGYVERGAEVLLVDDAATSGGSILKAVEGLRREYPECPIRHSLVVVDREEGAAANLAGHGIELAAIFTTGDFNIAR